MVVSGVEIFSAVTCGGPFTPVALLQDENFGKLLVKDWSPGL